MKVKFCVAMVVLLALMLPLTLVAGSVAAPANARVAAVKVSGSLPLSFEPTANAGSYLARSGRYAVLIGTNGASVAVTDPKTGASSILNFGLLNANPTASIEGIDPQPHTTNYYVGSDPSQWRLGVKNFAKLRSAGVYPGIDVVYYGDHRRLEFDYVVAPKADPSVIVLNFSGASKLYTDKGDLVADVNGSPIRFAKPVAYQMIDSKRAPVTVEYAYAGDKAQLKIGAYDKSRELVIDPVVDYATYLGGNQKDEIDGIALDPDGKTAYVTGQTCSPNFPNLASPVTKCSAYVSHINANGSALVGNTVVIGGSNNTWGHAIAVDASGTAYIVGETNSTDLPTANGVGSMVYRASGSQTTAYFGGDKDAFIAQINNGTLVKVAYLGGTQTDMGYGVAIDSGAGSPSGKPNVIATGETCYPTGISEHPDFPVYSGFQRKVEMCVGFITKLDNAMNLWVQDPVVDSWGTGPGAAPAGGQFYFSEYFGGQPPTVPNAVWMPNHIYYKGDIISVTFLDGGKWVSKAEKCVVTGTTGPTEPQWSTTTAALRFDGGVTWQNMGDPTALVNATTIPRAAAVDPLDDIFVAGGSDTDFIACKDCGDTSYWVGSGAWVLKVSKTGGWVYSTVLGSTKTDIANAIAVDGDGQAFVAGTSTGSLHIDASTVTFNSKQSGGQDGFVLKLDPAGTFVKYAGYLGGGGDDQAFGIAVDVSGAAYVVGSTKSTDFPAVNALTNTTTNQTMNSLAGSQDAFVTRIIPSGSAISFSTYVGGMGADQGYAVAAARNGEFVLAGGSTFSFDFPTHQGDPNASGVIQAAYNGGVDNDTGDAFAVRIPIVTLPSVAINDLNFPSSNLGVTTAAQSATFTNTGNTAITIGSFATTGDFAVTDPNSCTGKTLSTNQSCSVSVTFTPTAVGVRNGSLKFTDSAPGSPHTAALTGTGTGTSGIGITPNTSWNFANQEQNIASAAKTFTITNYGTSAATLAFSTGGTNASDFKITTDAQTTCSTTTPLAAAPATCTIAVTFTPGAVGARAGTLTVTSGSLTLTVNLSGSGTAPAAADFAVSAPSSGVTVGAGATKSITVSLSPTGGFNKAVTVTCSVPSPATCSASPASVTLDGTTTATTNVSVSVPAASGSGGGGGTRTGALHPALTFGTLPFCAALAFIGRRRKMWFTTIVLAVLALTLVLTGCGGGGGNSAGNGSGGMTPGTYNLVITATYSGTTPTTHATTVPLVVTN